MMRPIALFNSNSRCARRIAIEFYSIPESLQFRVVAMKITEAKKVEVKS